MEHYGWDLKTVGNQDRTDLKELMDRISKHSSDNGSQKNNADGEMTMADFVRSGKSHELGL